MARAEQLRRKCAKRSKGVPDQYKRTFTERQRSSMPPRCPDAGGSSGKSNNGGKSPTFERGGVKQQPRPGRRPSRVAARPGGA